MQATAAIFYASDAFSTSGSRLMGRQAAGESFLTGYFRHSGLSNFHCYAAHRAEAEAFAAQAASQVHDASVSWIPMPAVASLAEPGCLFYPAPGIGPLAWQRRAVGQRTFSLCGITHTISSERALDDLLGLVTAPTQDWDAVILTSVAVKDALIKLLQPYAEYLADRLGATSFGIPQLPVIPLGIDTDAYRPSDSHRATWRSELGIAEGEVAVLYMGRLSFHGKAHPFPMLAGLDIAAKSTGQRVHLIQAGWFANDAIEQVFRKMAHEHAPSVATHFLDGRRQDVRQEIWSAADIFVSLADNIQETFGLSPVEAMAAGLPCVVTDWDGYKESVRDGIDGFRIPTMLPPPGMASDLAQRFAAELDNYDVYIGKAGQITAVDIGATAKAFEILLCDPQKRKSMGQAAQARAREIFDWAKIIPQYANLWTDLAERRKAAPEYASARVGHEPNLTRPDPLRMFAHYSSAILAPSGVVSWRADKLDALWTEQSAELGLAIVATRAEIEIIRQRLRDVGPTRVADLLALFPSERQGIAIRSLVWLAKFGVVSVSAAGA